jgi:hypothetical protein
MSMVLTYLVTTESELADTDCSVIDFPTLEAEEYGPKIK